MSIEICGKKCVKRVNSIKEKLFEDKNRSVFTLGQAEVEYINQEELIF